jgi:putative transposase
MAKPLDTDLRALIVAAVEAGMSRRSAAARFDISYSAAIKLLQRYHATGSIAPGQMGGHKPLKLAAWQDWLMQRVGEKPDITTRELADELAERGIVVSHVSVWNLLKRENQSHKKKRARQRAE